MAHIGWNDKGVVLLSKAEGLRAEVQDRRDRSPNFGMITTSRRQHRKKVVDEKAEREKEEAALFTTDDEEVLAKKADGRVKWLYRGLMLAGKKTVPVNKIYETVTKRSFTAGVADVQGHRMYRLLMANLHIFSPKQQKHLQSDACGFTAFASAPESSKRSGNRSRRHSQRSLSPGRRSRSLSNSQHRQVHRKPRHRDSAAYDDGAEVSRSRSRSRKQRGSIQRTSHRPTEDMDDSDVEDKRVNQRGALDDFL